MTLRYNLLNVDSKKSLIKEAKKKSKDKCEKGKKRVSKRERREN
jgi:hypothetical protein